MYLDAEDVIQYIGKCAATALPSAKEGHPAFKCEEALGWKGMRALWVMISKSQTRLFILADDTRELVLASKFISTAATPLKSIQETKITVHLEGCCYIMKCPTHWYLRDVLVALRTEHRHVASVLPGILCGNWQVQERDSPLAASLNDVVGSLREQELNIVCKNKSSANIHRLRTCILRGFPFEYCREDIVELIRSIGISDAKDIIVGKKRNGDFNGYVKISLSCKVDFEKAQERLQGILVKDRYIEVLPENYCESAHESHAFEWVNSADTLTSRVVLASTEALLRELALYL